MEIFNEIVSLLFDSSNKSKAICTEEFSTIATILIISGTALTLPIIHKVVDYLATTTIDKAKTSGVILIRKTLIVTKVLIELGSTVLTIIIGFLITTALIKIIEVSSILLVLDYLATAWMDNFYIIILFFFGSFALHKILLEEHFGKDFIVTRLIMNVSVAVFLFMPLLIMFSRPLAFLVLISGFYIAYKAIRKFIVALSSGDAFLFEKYENYKKTKSVIYLSKALPYISFLAIAFGGIVQHSLTTGKLCST